jgi:hypothetical protein
MTVRRYLLLVSIAATAAYCWIYASGLQTTPVRSDGFGHFVFLPALVVDHDPSLETTARECCGGRFPDWAHIIRWPGTGRYVSAHPIGVSMLLLPMYVGAHALTWWSNFPPDGWSFYYQHAAGLGGVAILVAGLAVLGRALSRWHSPRVVVATLAVLTFGTNLFHYGTYDSVYSHIFSFFLVACLINLVPRWYEMPTMRDALLIGVVGGLIVLVRHPNAILLGLVPLYGLGTSRELVPQLALLWTRRRQVAVATGVFALVLAPQLALYHAATGRLFVSSYGQVWFNFASPHLFGVLFSVQKGVFFWSPVLLAGVAGWWHLRGQARGFVAPILVVVPLTTYIIAAWSDWQYGGSYGHRGFTDLLPLFGLGLGAAFERMAARRTSHLVLQVVVGIAVALSVAQMIQYWVGALPVSDLTWDQYRSGFLRFSR